MVTTSVREQVLQLIREERDRQLSKYGTNADLHHGFGAAWLYPYSMDCAPSIEAVFRADYENYEGVQGQPTWMHLIREEVAELFESAEREHTVSEAVQVAALCVSLAEQLMAPRAEVVPPPLPLSNANRGLIEKAYDDGFGGAFELTRDPENPSWVIGTYEGATSTMLVARSTGCCTPSLPPAGVWSPCSWGRSSSSTRTANCS